MHDMDSKHYRYFGIKKLIFGALLLMNGFLWPKWLGVDGWVKFVAILMILFGFVMLLHPAKKKKGKRK